METKVEALKSEALLASLHQSASSGALHDRSLNLKSPRKQRELPRRISFASPLLKRSCVSFVQSRRASTTCRLSARMRRRYT